MEDTTQTGSDFSRGRPCVHVDGDIAAQEEQTVSWQEADSINYAKSHAGGLKSGLSSLSPQETISDPRSPREQIPLTGNYSQERTEAMNVNDEGEVEECSRSMRKKKRVIETLKNLEKKKKEIWSGIGRKQGIKIATLNINGRKDEKKKDKWSRMTSLIRLQRIAVLGIQESHLNEEEAGKLEEKYPKLLIANNGTSTSKGGVTFVLNKELVNGMKWKHTALIENRASLLEIEIEQNRGLNIVLIYAPNIEAEKIEFWRLLREKLREVGELCNMTIMGDFNSVEEALDRYPHREDDAKVKESWKAIRNDFKLIDGWRVNNPVEKGYTYMQRATRSMSRIDRIYMNTDLCVYGYNWNHVETAMSDHNMVTAEVLKAKLPFIGKGVWRMYQDDIENRVVIKDVTRLLKMTEQKIELVKRGKSKDQIQRIWCEAKTEIKLIATKQRREREKQLKSGKEALKNAIETRLKKLSEEANEVDKVLQGEVEELRLKLRATVKNEQTKMRLAIRAKYRQEGEKSSKYWFGLNKEKMDDNTIIALTDKNDRRTSETRKMGEIAVQHHEALQKKPEMTQERLRAIEKITSIVKNKKIDSDQVEMLKRGTSREEIERAIKNTANGTSPGVDGIPYELYKTIIKREEKKEGGVDMIGILHDVITDIEKNGVLTLSTSGKKENEFTDGLMFLLYKKKDKSKIENYRPLTLLNTDYKIYTKTIADRLAKVAPTIIHEDQAGFVPGRSLYDHTKTTQMVIEYCEVDEKDGCIVALDQEKAYDKIDHDYLWAVLKAFEFPEVFVNRLKELYKNTEKAIMINGIVTRKFKVKRGVHQGDPMSCIIYDLAIEPLAEAIRNSSLKGIEICEDIDRLVVNLFADDTLVYLAEDDSLEILEKIIDNFCTASTAKFNLDKTEILPVGRKEFRENMIETRKMGKNVIALDKKIIIEGESMRTLGSWVGNQKSDALQWSKIEKSQEKVLEKWKRFNLTTKGKELVLKSLVQSKAIFMATVNGMPKEVEDNLKNKYHSFLWNEKPKGLIKWEQAIAKRSEGGLGIPDIRARVEAIEIMWLKKWLSPKDKRPKWAYIMDKIINKSIAKQPMVDEESRLNWLMQSWHESEAKDVKLSDNVKRILKVARKYNITPVAPKYGKKAKRDQPLWHNIMMKDANYQWNKKSARCLRNSHGVKTIGDLIDWDGIKDCNKACNKMTERLISMLPEKINPLCETPQKVRLGNLDHTPNRLKKNEESKNKKTFNPDITVRDSWEEGIRIFARTKGPKSRRMKGAEIYAPTAYRDEPGQKMTRGLVAITERHKNERNETVVVAIELKDRETREKRRIDFQIRRGENDREMARAVALLWIIKNTAGSEIEIRTDDKGIMEWIGGKLEKAENEGWTNVENENLWKMILRKLRKKGDKVKVILASKQSKTKKKIARMKEEVKNKKALNKATVRPSKVNEFNREGSQLTKMTQKRAYEWIMKQGAEKPGGSKTVENILKIREAAMEIGQRLKERTIWKGLQNIDNPQVADFIWKVIHGRVKCGPFFRYIPNWQDKEFCICGKSETVEHILTGCEVSGQREIWTVMSEKWSQEAGVDAIKINMGLVMGMGSIELKDIVKMRKDTAIRLWRKLVAITVWTIWKDRNDRIFNEKEASPERLMSKWKAEVKNEVRLDLWSKIRADKLKINKEVWTTNGTFAEIKKSVGGKEELIVK